MPRGYWRVVVAAFGFLILANAPPKGHDAASQQEQTSREIADALKGIDASLKQAPKPDVAEQPCERGENRRSSDLCAQWKAADAAASATTAAWTLGVIGSIIGIATLIAAVLAARYAKDAARHTERGADEARRAADAAEDGIAETIRIGEAQTRAYLSINSVEGKHTPKGLVFKVNVKNSGQSPALEAAVAFHFVLEDGAIESGEPGPSCPIPASSDQDLAYWYYPVPEARSWNAIASYVLITYKDVFDRINSVNASFAASPDEWDDKDFRQMTEGKHVNSYLRTMMDEETTQR